MKKEGLFVTNPIVDCFDGSLPTRTIGLHPNTDLVNTMPGHPAKKLGREKRPIIHKQRMLLQAARLVGPYE